MSEDSKLKQAVLDELEWDPSVYATHIEVSVTSGIVTLMGHVGSYAEKSAAERAARRVKDVHAIAEKIEVELPQDVKYGDEEIASAAIDRLAWDSTLPKNAIKATVERGLVTLTGEVDWHYQQVAAAEDIAGLWGVIGVSNQVTLKPQPNTSKIKDDILLALNRGRFDPATINVDAQGGTVTLTGKVGSWFEREEASATAWAAPGTISVRNELALS
jgi:osmotically-inducible protein OsmY